MEVKVDSLKVWIPPVIKESEALLIEKTEGKGNILRAANMVLGSDLHGTTINYLQNRITESNQRLKNEGNGDSQKGGESTRARDLLVKHAVSIAEEMNLVAANNGQTTDYKEPMGIVVDRLLEGSRELADKIYDKLPKDRVHFLFSETRFQKNFMDIEYLMKNAEKVDSMVRASGYTNIGNMVKAMLLASDGIVTIYIENKAGDKKGGKKQLLTIREMMEIVDGKSSEESDLATLKGPSKQYDKYEIRLMKVLIGLSTYQYFAQKDKDGMIQGLVASAAARSDGMVFSAEPGSRAEKLLSEYKDDIFNTEMLDAQRWKRNMDKYGEILELIMKGEIKFTLMDIKTSTLDRVYTNRDETNNYCFISDKEAEEKYSGDIAHTFQAVTQMVFGLNRMSNSNRGLTGLLGVHEHQDVKQTLREALDYMKVLYEMNFIVPRLHFGFMYGYSSSKMMFVDEKLVTEAEIQTSATKLDSRVSIRQKLTNYYQEMMNKIREANDRKGN